ncbi:phytanoyl-CoA dioxygenase (PhyH) family protein [Hyphomonas adhaerens MHS-3]|uniref:Phytanoyl-CoA dioxygenase (PhyH) family protein n=1 Tax=Hyphomonas adhaerens MHS-3 TaxID=1280949 RepID=A0A069E3Q5_9PROT|nr:phytanoyl-CoA dioxygenase family protein [Hyphomonas adhaerens]KCZ84815.1 phytanoyl-CoA dioxygenase (PhyH) family protein [Hyphomonas adhaerens MHS-3]
MKETVEIVPKTDEKPEVDLAFWEQNGYYVLPKFLSDEQVDAIVNETEEAWKNRRDDIVADNQIYSPTQKRVRNYLDRLSEEERTERYVMNDLFLVSDPVRSVSLDPKLVHVLRELLGTEPVLCQSLNFKWGSGQGMHQDTLYLPPPNERDMIAIWVALEDIHPDSGPLRYMPGSHNIPVYRFSNGKIRVIPGEVSGWDDHIAQHTEQMGLQEQVNHAKKGDVFIWHAFLLHGGSPIQNWDLTRKSLVCHYYSKSDLESVGGASQFDHGGYWWPRSPQLPR